MAVSVHGQVVTSTITVGTAPWGVAYDSGKGEVFVVSSGLGQVWVLSDSGYSVVAKVTVGQSPYRDVYDSGKGEVFVANYGANTVSVISDKTNTVVATVKVGSAPLFLRLRLWEGRGLRGELWFGDGLGHLG